MNGIETKEISIIINMFIVYFQSQGIWLCHHPVGEEPRRLSSDEALNLTKDFIVEFNRQ